MVPQIKISLVGVLAAGVANMVVGAVWYSPLLFGKRWLAFMGWSQEELERRKKQGMSRAYGGTFAASLVQAYILAHGVDYAGAASAIQGAAVGFWLWLGFVAATGVGSYLFEGRPLRLYAINSGCHLAGLAVMGALVSVL